MPGAVVRDVATHIARTQPYALTEVLHDLLSLAARALRLGEFFRRVVVGGGRFFVC